MIEIIDDSDEDDEVVFIPRRRRKRQTAVEEVDLVGGLQGFEEDPYDNIHTKLLNFFPGLTAQTFRGIRDRHDAIVSAGKAFPQDFEEYAIGILEKGFPAGNVSSSASSSVGSFPVNADSVLAKIRPLFPLVDAAYARSYVEAAKRSNPNISEDACVQLVALKLSEDKDYKKIQTKPAEKALPERDFREWKNVEAIQKWKNGTVYRTEAVAVLADAFRRVPVRVINQFLKSRNGYYYPTKVRLQQEMNTIQLLSRKRSYRLVNVSHLELVREMKWEKSYEQSEQEKRDAEAAIQLNDEEAAKNSTAIECGCCYTDRAFENMIQCTEGHLFCRDCLKHYAQERLFGCGVTGLKCMDTAGCTGKFVRTQLERALPKKVLEKFEEAEAKECVEKLKESAGLPGLFSCPHCDTAAEVPETVVIFVCPNSSCGKETCKKCKRESHIPLRCDEVVDKEETAGRVSIEEKMTEMRLRTCSKCSTRFFKTEGCNRMVCRCGMSMCYICRKSNVSYQHFGAGRCQLHSDTYKEDMAAVLAAGEKAKQQELAKADADAKKRLEKVNVATMGQSNRQKRKSRTIHRQHAMGVGRGGYHGGRGWHAAHGQYQPNGGHNLMARLQALTYTGQPQPRVAMPQHPQQPRGGIIGYERQAGLKRRKW